MLPIVSIGNFFSFLAYFLVFILIYFSYKKNNNKFTLYFLKSFGVTTIFFFVISLPGLIFKDPVAVGLVFLASYILLYLMVVSFIIIPLRALKLPKIEKIILFFILGFLAFTVIAGNAYFKPASIVFTGNFLYWLPNTAPIIRIFSGLASSITGLLFIITILITGFKSSDKKVLRRAMILGGAMAVLAAASAVNFLAGATPSPNSFLSASILTVLSAFLFLGGVFYKAEDPNYQ